MFLTLLLFKEEWSACPQGQNNPAEVVIGVILGEEHKICLRSAKTNVEGYTHYEGVR